MKLVVRKHDDSLGINLPEEVALELNLKEGDELYFLKTKNGYELTATDPDLTETMESYKNCLKKYRNALLELAK